MKIDIEDADAKIHTEYNADFVCALKRTIGGAKWDSYEKCWIVPKQSIETCRELMMKYYGETDITQSTERFSVKFYLDAEQWRGPVVIFGRSLATAFGRDSGARLGTGFEIVDGQIGSGGSCKNWTTWVRGTFIAHNVTQAMLDRETLDEESIEIIHDNADYIDVNALQEEKERLLKRIQEIDNLLAV